MQQSQVVLVTGGGAGIGKATAFAYAEAGCDVVVADLHADQAEAVATGIRNLGRRSLAVQADMGDADAIALMHQAVIAEFDRLDYACNNAGIEGQQAPTAETTLANFDQVININLRGVFLCMQEQLRIMLKQQSGSSIVNIASVAGLIGFPGLPAYCASKGGVVQLTKTAALEYAEQNIRVNAICPGAIKTDMIDRITHQDPEIEKQFAALHAMNRMGTAQEVADAIVFLSMPSASFITGQAIAIDGGFTSR